MGKDVSKLVSIFRCDNAPSWLPSILNVYLLVVCEMCSRRSLENPSVLLPALRLLTYLLEGGRLDPPDHSTAASSSSSNLAASWWASGGDAEALELLQRLQELEMALDPSPLSFTSQISSSKFPTSNIHIFLPEIPLQEQLGCPLHILCRLVHFRLSIFDRDDVRRLCRLLTEVRLTSALSLLVFSSVCLQELWLRPNDGLSVQTVLAL